MSYVNKAFAAARKEPDKDKAVDLFLDGLIEGAEHYKSFLPKNFPEDDLPVLIFAMQVYLQGLEPHRTKKCNDILSLMKETLGQTCVYARMPVEVDK